MSEVVVITGASTGVGRATARAFAKRGASIALLARDTEALRICAVEVAAAGGRALPLPTDVSDADAVDAAAERAERELGPIDIWINVAMTTIFAPVHSIAPAEFKRATEVTYLGFVYGTMAALKRMRARNRGTIVQVGSALAYRAIPLQAAYCGAKFAIRGFTDSLRTELLHERLNIHVTMVQMPALDTPQFDWARNRMPHRPQPVPPIFQPEVAARAIVFAAHARRREVWVSRSAAPPSRPFSPTRSLRASSTASSHVTAIAVSSPTRTQTPTRRIISSTPCQAIPVPTGASIVGPRPRAPLCGPRCTGKPCSRWAPPLLLLSLPQG